MAEYLVQEETLTDIADAIREQTGDSDPIMLSNFASEIASITGGSNTQELTQAEYDALSTAEKNNGTIYFITDSSDTSEVVYSTSERAIGRWVDGSVLYEKTVSDTFTSGSTRLDISFGIGSNNFRVISIEGVLMQSGSPLSSPFNATTPTDASYTIKSVEGYSLYADNGIRIERQNAQAYGSTPTAYVTIRYIKVSAS